MKYLLILSALLVLNCATPSKQPRNVIGDPPVTDKPVIVEEEPLEDPKPSF
ncbi:MAG: hypothetical protein HKO54_11210 [Flavobacteriaceae bacterium]|nr:hypothetical protein [Flavobacteriaceae bacterium]